MGSQEDRPQMLAGGKGSCLEIFLFTNGQQESPPRKYNVRVHDRWDTTLNFLARSQTGSNHTIELYSTEGKRIERGLELRNGAAYVAVEPPHVFLPAGYNDYLMKASRSREKRQEKISENDSLNKPDKNNSKDNLEEEIKDATNIKIIQDITVCSTSGTAVEEQDDITKQVKSDIAKAVKPIRRMSIKQTQKRNSSLPQQNPYILKKYTNNVTPPIKRGSNSSKIDASKKKVEIISNQNTKNPIASTKPDPIMTKTNESKSKGDEAGVIGISHTRNTESVDDYHVPKNTDLSSRQGTGATDYNATQNLTPVSTIIERNILLPVSGEKEPRESASIIPIKTIPDILNSSPSSVSRQADFPKATNITESKPAFLPNVPSERSQKNTLIFGSQTNDNNFTIYVKQDNTVNLKLNIEVLNVSSATIEVNHNLLSSSLVENNPLKQFEGQTSASNISGARNYREMPTLTEPWVAGLPFEQLQQITNDLKVGVCNCCLCSRNPESVAPVFVDNNNYFIFLPPENVKGHLVSCPCNMEMAQQNESEIPDHKVVKLSRIDNPNAAKLDGGIQLLPTHTFNMTDNSEIKKSHVIHDAFSIENLLISEDASVTKGEANQCDCYVTSARYQTSPCDCGQSLAPKCAACESCVHDEATCADVIKQNAPDFNTSSMLKEAFTQTDWTGIVLEARARDDGSYAFHIPSLKALKNTNNLY